MKGVILYYSLNGSTDRLAKALAKQNGFRLCRIYERKKRTIAKAFLSGCRQAIKRAEVELAPAEINWTGAEKAVIACPVWAGYPAPAFNSMIKLIPRKLPCELYFVSGSGSSQNSRRATLELLAEKGYNITGYNDVMTKSLYPRPEGKKGKKGESR